MASRIIALVSIVLFAVLAVSASLLTPTFEFLDERDHYAYVRALWVDRTLPVLDTSTTRFQQYYQPPLYHFATVWVAALTAKELEQPIQYRGNPFFVVTYDRLTNDNKNMWLHNRDEEFPYAGTPRAVHVARLASVLFGIAHGFVLLKLGQELFAEAEVAAIFTGLVLLLPGFVSISSVLSTDNATALTGSLVLLTSLQLLRAPDERRRWVWLACSLSAATLSKTNTLFMGPAIGLAIVFAWMKSGNRRRLVGNFLLLVLIWLAATGWWFVRNILIYGDLTGISASREQLGQGGEFSFARLWASLPLVWQTFLGRFANTTAPMPAIVYYVFALLFVAALLGWGWRMWRQTKKSNMDSLPIYRWVIVATAAAGIVGAVLYHAATNNTGAQGRLMYPALSAIAALVLSGLLVFIPVAYSRWVLRSTWLGMAALSFVAVFGWTVQTQVLPPRYDSFTPPTGFHVLNYIYDDSIVLRGYTISSERAAPGDTLTATLYWQTDTPIAEDYAVFLQLVDKNNNKIGQRDTYSGGGLFPTSRWQPGQVVADSIDLTVAPNAPGPRVYALLGGLWDVSTGERLPVQGSGTAAVYKLGEVVIPPRDNVGQLPPDASELNVEFSSGVVLQGCLPPVSGSDHLALFWSAAESVSRDYTVAVHIWDESNTLVAGLDHPPAEGQFPTHFWQPNDWIEDRFALPGAEQINRIDVGLYTPDTLERLPILNPSSADNLYTLPSQCWAS